MNRRHGTCGPVTWVFCLCLALATLAGTKAPLQAAAPAAPGPTPVCTASLSPALSFPWVRGDRSRMIQVAVVGVALGIFILMWHR